MENQTNCKLINGVIYKPCWSETFRSLPTGGEIKLNRHQLTYNTASSICRALQRNSHFSFSITSCDKLQDEFIIKRLS